MSKIPFRKLPSVDRLKKTEAAHKLTVSYDEDNVVDAIRKVVQDIREEIAMEKSTVVEKDINPDAIMTRVKEDLEETFALSLRNAINATGVILHTGLGRSVLPDSAQKSITEVMAGYSTLATEIETGKRSHRDIHLNDLLCALTGAEAATVVNNNAAATMLILNSLAKGREVIVSRGQLVEIGGSFRMPDVMLTSGAVLKEVGTTNKTHLRDYEAAIGEDTGAIMRVHHSNYRIVGFAAEPSIEEMADVAHKHKLYIIDDLGSGALIDLKAFGIEHEPLVQDSIKAGVDVACFSSDKLIGGPQAGIIVGKASIIEKIRKNPLTRAFRIGKLTIAGIQATLQLFLKPDKLKSEHPVYRMFDLSVEQIRNRAQRIAKRLKASLAGEADISLIDGGSQVGSGAVPVETIPTKLLKFIPKNMDVETLAKYLRFNEPPIFTRVQKGAVLFDFRTVQKGEDRLIIDALSRIFKQGASGHV